MPPACGRPPDTNLFYAPGPVTASRPAVALWKRALDLVVIFLLVPFWAPLAILISAIIKVVSPGPVLFKQVRIGLRGAPFECLKFRTMRPHAEITAHQQKVRNLIASKQPMTKLDSAGDPRIIPFGAILRSLGLDELPQLINVWRGEMSLVGPRPCLPYEFELYQPHHRRRLSALPGLTGLWQVSGKNRTTFEEMVALDIDYAQRQSLWLDLKIMALTPTVLFLQLFEVLKSRLGARFRSKNRQAARIRHNP